MMTDFLSPEERSVRMAKIRSRDTTPERFVRSILHSAGYRFRLHRRDLPGVPDLTLPRYRTVIFVNGCFWHWHADPKCSIAGLPKSNLDYWKPKLARTRSRDQEHNKALSCLGWRVLTVWECELRDPVELLTRIRGFLHAGALPEAESGTSRVAS